MSGEAAQVRSTTPSFERRAFLVGGASLVAAGALASTARAAGGASEEPASLLVAGVVGDHVSRKVIDVDPVGLDNRAMRSERVRVELADDSEQGRRAQPLDGFEVGTAVGIRLPAGRKMVNHREYGDGGVEVSIGFVNLVLGEPRPLALRGL